MTFFAVIINMINTVLEGGSIRYLGVPFSYIFKGIFFNYMPYYIVFCLLTAGFYYLIGKLKGNKK